MSPTLKKYLVCYAANIAAVSFEIISQMNHWFKWPALLCIYFTAGLFIYLYWKNETLPPQTKWIRTALLILFFPVSALVFIIIKSRDERAQSR
jgi:hypothetical protein